MSGLSFAQELHVNLSDIGAITGSSKSSFRLVCLSDANDGSSVDCDGGCDCDCDCDLDGGATADCGPPWLGTPYAGEILGNSVIIARWLVRRSPHATKCFTKGTCSALGTYTYQYCSVASGCAAPVERRDLVQMVPEACCHRWSSLVKLAV